MKPEGWSLGAEKDTQSVTPEWEPVSMRLISGVVVREAKHVVTSNGIVTELYRRDWETDAGGVGQVFQRSIVPGGVSAWHAHEVTIDRLFVISGTVRLVLYDGRPGSESEGALNTFQLSACRPTLVVVPPKVWHGLHNHAGETATLINVVDHAYSYHDPDHWRLPPDSDRIPYRFEID